MKQYGLLAKNGGFGDIEVQVCQSGAGYYIGPLDPRTGEPISRESSNYYPTYEVAKIALDKGTWIQRQNP